MRPCCLGLLLWLLVHGAAADIYRCVDAEGRVRFSDDPAACPDAALHAPSREIQRSGVASEPAARADTPSTFWQGTAPELLALFPPVSALGPGWEVVEEAVSDPAADPDLWAQGVRTVAARHYTRGRAGSAQACSLEIWAFVSEGAARGTHEVYAPEGWKTLLHGNLLLQLRGVSLVLGAAPRKGIAPECEPLLALASARIDARGR